MSLFRQWQMGPCFYCDRPMFRMGATIEHPAKYTRDHLVPRNLRGNLQGVCLKGVAWTVGCCYACNTKKGNQSAYRFIERKFIRMTKHKRDIIDRAYALVGLGLAEAQQKSGTQIATI